MLESCHKWHELADVEMIDWCARLNAIPGVETRQSCSGHRVGDVGKAEGLYAYETNGTLWFICSWMTPDVAFALARIPTMDRVELIFFPDGDAVWDLSFAGKNKNCLAISMGAILQILSTQSNDEKGQ